VETSPLPVKDYKSLAYAKKNINYKTSITCTDIYTNKNHSAFILINTKIQFTIYYGGRKASILKPTYFHKKIVTCTCNKVKYYSSLLPDPFFGSSMGSCKPDFYY
jgi:hypothetical protein